MQNFMKRILSFTVVGLLWSAASASATVLTFDIFTNDTKTARFPNTFVPQSYGDNVNDFNPSGSFGGNYYDYGSGGGLTPNVTVEYRYLKADDPTNPSLGVNGPPNGLMWDTLYGDLQYVVYDAYGGACPNCWYMEMRLTPAPGYRVTLDSFDIAAWPSSVANISYSGQTLKIVQDANSAAPPFMWSAGPDFGVTVKGNVGGVPVHDAYSPNVTVEAGHTLSLIYGLSGNIGVDNVSFSQSLIPEPSTCALATFAAVWVWLRRRSA